MVEPTPLKTTQNSLPVAALRCPNMLAVASGKGGVGKTWFAVTLCHALAKRGKRTLLFDGDLGLANVDIQLGLTPEKDLGDVIDGQITLRNAVTRYDEGKFDILAGRSGSGNLAALPAHKLSVLRNELISMAESYDYVIVDLGAGVDRAVRQMAGPAAAVYVILTDEPTSLTDAYAFIKLSRAADPEAVLRIVVNLAANGKDGRKTYETLRKVCANFLGFEPPLAGVVRRDPKVRDAIRAQTSLLTRSPVSDAAEDVEAIAENIIKHP